MSQRVPRDLLAAFTVDGPNWQTRMNEALAAAAAGMRGRRGLTNRGARSYLLIGSPQAANVAQASPIPFSTRT